MVKIRFNIGSCIHSEDQKLIFSCSVQGELSLLSILKAPVAQLHWNWKYKYGLRLCYTWDPTLTQTVYIIQPTEQPLYRIHYPVPRCEPWKTKQKNTHQNFCRAPSGLWGKTFPLTLLRVCVAVEDPEPHSSRPPFYLNEPCCNVGPVNHGGVFVCVDRVVHSAHSCHTSAHLKTLFMLYAPLHTFPNTAH